MIYTHVYSFTHRHTQFSQQPDDRSTLHSPFHRQGKWSAERLSSVPKVTLLISGRAGHEPRQTGFGVSAQSHRTRLHNAANNAKESLLALLGRKVCREQFQKLWFSQLPIITKTGNTCGQSYLPVLLLHRFYTNFSYQAQLPFDKPG